MVYYVALLVLGVVWWVWVWVGYLLFGFYLLFGIYLLLLVVGFVVVLMIVDCLYCYYELYFMLVITNFWLCFVMLWVVVLFCGLVYLL